MGIHLQYLIIAGMIFLRDKLSLSEYRLGSLRGTVRSSVVFMVEAAVGFEVGGWRAASSIGLLAKARASLLARPIEPETVSSVLVDEQLWGVLYRTRNRLDRTCRGRAERLFVISAILLSMNLIFRYFARNSTPSLGFGWLWASKCDALRSFSADDPTTKPFNFARERFILPPFSGLL